MCGVAGFIGAPSGGSCHPQALLSRMGEAIRHRGPDSDGVWWDAETEVGFVHRRLAIIDLSGAGHQPMRSHSGRYTITFNGEIYNHSALRLALSGTTPVAWSGHSDTETLLAAFDVWGIKETLRRSQGMFAMAIWDARERRITLARDRFGEKPLYYQHRAGQPGSRLLFGSELKALTCHPDCSTELDPQAIGAYLRFNHIPSPASIYVGVRKLEPGMLLHFEPASGQLSVEPYWSTLDALLAAKERRADSPKASLDGLEALLMDVIRNQSAADVPLGAFLSGGVDSSLIVALMQAHCRQVGAAPVKTFTAGFELGSFDESDYARRVAAHLGTAHTEFRVSAADALSVIQRLPAIYDEPFSDSSQIPTVLICQLARQHVTVALSGDGGDELFGGYNRHQFAARHWPLMRAVPQWLRLGMRTAIRARSPEAWDSMLSRAPLTLRWAHLGEKLYKLGGILGCASFEEAYVCLISQAEDPEQLIAVPPKPWSVDARLQARMTSSLDPAHYMMALDLLGYLPGDVLAKVDRAAMAASLETRVPFLDHRVMEYAWRMPLDMKIHDGKAKWALKQVLYRHVPQALIDRPKMGFGVPIAQWLRGPLRDWADDLLATSALRREGHFNADKVAALWSAHRRGQGDHQHVLWSLLVFNQWHQARKAS